MNIHRSETGTDILQGKILTLIESLCHCDQFVKLYIMIALTKSKVHNYSRTKILHSAESSFMSQSFKRFTAHTVKNLNTETEESERKVFVKNC